MVRFKAGYPLTSYLVTQSTLGALIRMGDIKALVGRMEPHTRRAIVIESVIFSEQFLRLAAERFMGGKEGRVSVHVSDVGASVSVKRARVLAAQMVFQSKRSVENLAANLCVNSLKSWLRSGGGARLSRMYWFRHALAHSVAIVKFDEVRVFTTAESLAHALLGRRSREMVACWLVEGARLGSAGHADGARRAYGAALEACDWLLADGRAPGAWVHLSRGHALARLGRRAEAEASYREGVRSDPGSAPAHLELANLLALAGRTEEAHASYERSISIDPRYVPARTYMGHALIMRPDMSGMLAVECYEGALRLSAGEMSARTGLGLCLAAEGRYGEAIDEFRKAVRLDGADTAPRTGLAHALAAVGRNDEAIDAYRKAARIAAEAGLEAAALYSGYAGEKSAEVDGPAFALGISATHRGLGSALLKAGRSEEAVRAYGRAVEIDGGSAEAHRGLGSALSEMGRNEEAVRAYGRAVEIDGGSAEAHRGLGKALALTGRLAEALESYKRANAVRAGHDLRWDLGI